MTYEERRIIETLKNGAELPEKEIQRKAGLNFIDFYIGFGELIEAGILESKSKDANDYRQGLVYFLAW